MSWVLEQPVVILFIGAFLFALAAAFWLQTRSRPATIALWSVFAITALWLLTERLIVTDAEQVKLTIKSIARDLEENDVDRVLAHIASSNPDLLTTVQMTLAAVTVQKVSVKQNLTATVMHRNGQSTAEARFNAVAIVTDRAGLAGRRTVPRFVIVRLRKEDGRWRVHSYELHDPRGVGSGRQGMTRPDLHEM